MAKRLDFYIGTVHLGYTQKADLTPEISNDVINTFDGPVPDIAGEPSWELTIDKLRYAGTVEEFIKVESLIYSTRTTPQNIQIIETFKSGSNEQVRVKEIIYNCSLTDKKASFDVETRTAENLGFKGTKLRKWVNKAEIPI